MVSESVMSAACSEFTQNAWRKELCSNCQRPKAEHSFVNGSPETKTSSPVPQMRKSLLIGETSELENNDVINLAKRNAALILNAVEKQNDEKAAKKKGTAEVQKTKTSVSVKTEVFSYKSILLTNKLKGKNLNVNFLEDPAIIGEDGGYDNLFLEHDEEIPDSESSTEELSFTEEEREFVMRALENTIWNSDIKNLSVEKEEELVDGRSKEFEDIHLLSMWKADRFATLRDCDKLIPRRFGTFPLRKSGGSKLSLESVFHKQDAGVRSSSDVDLHRIEEESREDMAASHYETNFSLFEKRRSRSASEMVGFSSEGKKSKAGPYKVVKVSRIISGSEPVVPKEKDESKSDSNLESEDFPEELTDGDLSVFNFENLNAENLFENFNTEIDLESSTAGMALVDLLNDVLARYSDGESFKGFEDQDLIPDENNQGILNGAEGGKEETTIGNIKIPKGSIKSKEFEAKLKSLAVNLDLNRKRAKKPAPRPPNSPPPQPTSSMIKKSSSVSEQTEPVPKPSSPQKSLPEPNFKMVPIGKSILDGQQEKPLSPKRTGDFQEDPTDVSKSRTDNKNKKSISSFFKSFLRRGKDSPENSNDQISESSMTKVSSDRSISDKDNQAADRKEPGRSSPQMKTKVLPTPTSRNTRTSIIMVTSDSSTSNSSGTNSSTLVKNSPKNRKKNLPKVEEDSEAKIIVTSETSVEKDVAIATTVTVKPNVPIRPKPPPNPNKPCISPQLSQKDLSRTSPVRERKDSAESDRKDSVGHESERESRSRISSTDKDARFREGSEEKSSESLNKEGETSVVRRRAKSPKRVSAPLKPNMPGPRGLDNRSSLFAKELEMRLSKNLDPSKVAATPSKPKVDIKKAVAPLPPPSPPSPKAEPPAVPQTPVKEESEEKAVSTVEQEKGVVEKIELPRATSRKSFLGKLGNKKSRAPPRPPSVIKRAKSISENSSSGDGHTKKIDVSDISGPVLITPMTGNSSISRRNTITIGDDSFVSGGSTSSGSTTADKYDEWPEFSPLGSLENLYEPIVPKEPPPPPPTTQSEVPPTKGHVYDPLSSSQTTSTSQTVSKTPVDGYLEPVRSTTSVVQGQMSTSLMQVETEPVSMVAQIMQVKVEEALEIQEPEISEERRRLLASQPIYEEINGYGKDVPNKGEITPEEKLTLDVTDAMINSVHFPPMSPSPSHSAMSSESEPSSACSTLNRPKPIPRKRSRKAESMGSEQPYVAMNRPNITSALNESQLRDMLNQLTSMNLHTLRDIYTQFEKVFTKEIVNLTVPGAGPLKWHDFDIYGKPVHSSERCIVYNAKLKTNLSQCQLMLLHTKPNLMSTQHPSLLRPTVIFSDAIPFSYLTEDFIKTSQLLHNLQNSVNQSNFAKCFVAIGQFDITDNLNNQMMTVRQGGGSVIMTLEDQMEVVLFYVLQILSAISYCLDQGFSLGEANFRDVFLVTNGNGCHGNIVAFLPHQKYHDSTKAESVFVFLEKYIAECLSSRSESEFGKFYSGVLKIQNMLQHRKIEILSLTRSYIEFLLWGPSEERWQGGVERQSSLEPKLSGWLEKERASMVHNFAKSAPQGDVIFSVKDFYRMKFLLKASAVSLSECVRTHMSY